MEWLHRLFVSARCMCSWMECKIFLDSHIWTSSNPHRVSFLDLRIRPLCKNW